MDKLLRTVRCGMLMATDPGTVTLGTILSSILALHPIPFGKEST